MATITRLEARLSKAGIFCLLCFLATISGFRGTGWPALQFDVFPGYDSVVREAHWFPVTFEVKNDGPGFAGFIEFANTRLGGGQIRRVPLELPTGTLKRITIPVFSANNYASWMAKLKSDRGRTLAEQEITPTQIKHRAPGTTLLGALTRTASGQPQLPAIKRNQAELQPTVARLQPSIFPDNPITLEGLDCIYLNSERALELKQPQVSALLAWLHGGGHLLVGIEQIGDVTGTPWLRELLPCELLSMQQVKTEGHFREWLRLGNKGGFTVSSAENAFWTAAAPALKGDPAFENASMEIIRTTIRDGRIMASAGDVPLAVEAYRGNGKITVLLFSPERQPFVSWENRAWLWAKLADLSPELYQSSDYFNYGGWSVDGLFGALIESKQIRKLPLTWLLLLLVAYLAIIGPVDQIWLKRINRQMLTWITFPLYVIAFSGLIYLIGFKLRAGDSEWNELHVVDILAKGEGAVLRGRTYASIYSPANERYGLQGKQPVAAFRGEYLSNYGSGNENSQAEVIYHGNNFSAEVFVPVWTSQLYVNEWLQPIKEAPLQVTVTSRSGAGVKLKIQNTSNRKLTRVRLCLASRVHEIGELDPNSTREISLAWSAGQPLRDFVCDHGSHFTSAVEHRRRTFGSGEPMSFDLQNSAIAACFVSQLDQQSYRRFVSSSGIDLSRWSDSEHVILLAWDADHSPIEPMKQFSSRRSSKNTLLRLIVPLAPQL